MNEMVQVPRHLVREFGEKTDELSDLRGKPGFAWARHKYAEWMVSKFPILKDREWEVEWGHALHPQIRVGRSIVPVVGVDQVTAVYRIPDDMMFKLCELQDAPPSRLNRYDMWEWLMGLAGWPSTTPVALMGRYVVAHASESTDPRGKAEETPKVPDLEDSIKAVLKDLGLTSDPKPAVPATEDVLIAYGLAMSAIGHAMEHYPGLETIVRVLIDLTSPAVGDMFKFSIRNGELDMGVSDAEMASKMNAILEKLSGS